MFQRKAIMVATILTLSITLVGCASTKNKNQTPAPSQNSVTTGDLSQVHPSETPAQAGSQTSQEDAEQKINDYLTKNYPGDWKVEGTILSKGSYTENNNYKIVDGLEQVFPGTMGVSIFVGEKRISSNVKQGTERVLEGYPTPATVGEVMKSGKVTSMNSSGYLKVYVPLKTGDKTVAVLTVSIPQN
jgi:hypothetical protein